MAQLIVGAAIPLRHNGTHFIFNLPAASKIGKHAINTEKDACLALAALQEGRLVTDIDPQKMDRPNLILDLVDLALQLPRVQAHQGRILQQVSPNTHTLE